MTLLLSTLIGLVLAFSTTVPLANASDVTKTSVQDIAGYTGIISPGEFTGATAEWNQPAVTCQPGLTETEAALLAVGNSTAFSIIGTVGDCFNGRSGYFPVVGFARFTERLLIFNVPLVFFKPGDTLSTSINVSPSTQMLTASITDVSTGDSESGIPIPMPLGSLPPMPTVVGWAVSSLSSSSGPAALGQFNVPIRFSNCTVTVSGNTFTISKGEAVTRFTMVDSIGNLMATTSSLSRGGSSFKVGWVSST